jgi:hypothetical protein
MQRQKTGVFAATIGGLIAVMTLVICAYADSVTLAPSADTSLFENEPDNNLGASLSLVSGANTSGFRSRELMRFDFTGQIPTNAIVQSVTLVVYVVTVPGNGGGVASVFDMHRLLVDWNEGIGSGNMGSNALTGETTWNHRFYPDTNWTVPGGGISNDFSATVSASLLWDAIGTYTYNSTSNLVADVQQWAANPATNFGWMFISESENVMQTARRLGSRESGSTVPALTAQFTLPVSAPAIQNVQASGGTIQFSFSATGGQACVVQYSGSLSPGSWQTLTNIPAPPASTNIVVSDTLTNAAARFYRVAIPQ